MSIILYRLDERLIHGQVVVGWGTFLKVKKIVIASDRVASNPWERELYLSCTPSEIQASVFTVEKTAGEILNGSFGKANTVILFDSPKDVLNILEKGVKIEFLNLGGMHFKQGREKILPYLYLSEEEIAQLKKIITAGVVCECRDVPSAGIKNLAELLAKRR